MRPLDVGIVVAYLAGIVAVGITCRGRTASVDEYFTAPPASFRAGWARCCWA